MNNSKKVALAALIALVVVFVCGVIYYARTTPPNTPIPEGTSTLPAPELPEATGNLDDTTDALLQGAKDELTAIGNGDYEAAEIASDHSEASDFSQSVNQNEF